MRIRPFDKQYAINLSQLKSGVNQYDFNLADEFFGHFDYALTTNGDISATVKIRKFETCLDIVYKLEGRIELECDRCLSPYEQAINHSERVLYAPGDVNYLELGEGSDLLDNCRVELFSFEERWLILTQEFYEGINLSVPFRKVPDEKLHKCPEEVLDMLGLSENSSKDTDSSDMVDPRWEALKKLKEQRKD